MTFIYMYDILIYYSCVVTIIQVGEKILAINGESTENMTHKEAVTLLKQSQGSVEMEVAPAPEDDTSADDSGDDSLAHGYVFIKHCSWFVLCELIVQNKFALKIISHRITLL